MAQGTRLPPAEKKIGTCTDLMVPSEDQEKVIIKSIDCDKRITL